jgi:hypothetical protein
MTDAALRSESLRAAQLRGLIRRIRPAAELASAASSQVSMLTDGSAWALAAGADPAGASAAVVRLLRVSGAGERHLVVDPPQGSTAVLDVVAWRLATLGRPPFLWQAAGADLVAVPVPSLDEAVAAAGPPAVAEPDPRPAPLEALAAALARDVPAVRVERDHPGWILAVRGLEIARLAVAPETGSDTGTDTGTDTGSSTGTGTGTVELALGVGRFDRAAHVEVSGPRLVRPAAFAGHVEAIGRVAADVVARRRRDAPPHPARTLRAERWLRERVLEDPALVGRSGGPAGRWARRLTSPVAPANLQEWSVAPLLAEDAVLVCAVGLRPELPLAAAHAWLQAAALGRPVPLRVVVPERDAAAVLPGWLAALRPELAAAVVPVPDDWTEPRAGGVGVTSGR